MLLTRILEEKNIIFPFKVPIRFLVISIRCLVRFMQCHKNERRASCELRLGTSSNMASKPAMLFYLLAR
uniref:Uncharacterized protein n=1 Tax=Oryza brachyantha TaxID=4533 RepID=J3KV40_ORYBR